MTIMSKAFGSERRLWHLKVDVCSKTHSVSVFLVERGDFSSQGESRNVPIEFSSVKVQFEITDAAYAGRKSVLFFSFGHDQNQVIGHRDIANLDNLVDPSRLTIRVAIEEYLFHSAIMHYLADNF